MFLKAIAIEMLLDYFQTSAYGYSDVRYGWIRSWKFDKIDIENVVQKSFSFNSIRQG